MEAPAASSRHSPERLHRRHERHRANVVARAAGGRPLGSLRRACAAAIHAVTDAGGRQRFTVDTMLQPHDMAVCRRSQPRDTQRIFHTHRLLPGPRHVPQRQPMRAAAQPKVFVAASW
eukprot:365422-Chlamydomonas_euryale.AAC.2